MKRFPLILLAALMRAKRTFLKTYGTLLMRALSLLLAVLAMSGVTGARHNKRPPKDEWKQGMLVPLHASSEIQKSVAWLQALQNPDGGWGEQAGDPSWPWTTAEALDLLLSLDYPEQERLDRAVTYLLRTQNADGGWGDISSTDSITNATSWVLLSLSRARRKAEPTERIPLSIERAARWLIQSQRDDGSWGLRPGEAASTYSTVYALRSLAESGRFEPTISRGLTWLRSGVNGDGGWGTTVTSKSEPAITAHVALLFLDLKAESADSIASRAADFLLNCPRNAAGWSPTEERITSGTRKYVFHYFATPFVLRLLLLTDKAPPEVILPAVRSVRAMQEPTGGWRHPEFPGPTVWATNNAVTFLHGWWEEDALRMIEASLEKLHTQGQNESVGNVIYFSRQGGFFLSERLYWFITVAIWLGALVTFGVLVKRLWNLTLSLGWFVVASSLALFVPSLPLIHLLVWSGQGNALTVVSAVLGLDISLLGLAWRLRPAPISEEKEAPTAKVSEEKDAPTVKVSEEKDPRIAKSRSRGGRR